MSNHTNAPWTANIGNRGAHINVDNDYNHPLSFGVGYDESMAGEAEANILLITAAPDLLAACKSATAALQQISPLAASGTIVRLDEAIQKAEPKKSGG